MTEWRAEATPPLVLIIAALLSGSGAQSLAAQAAEGDPTPDSAASVRGPIQVDSSVREAVRGAQYTSLLGPRAAWLGREDGSGEVWVHPYLVASDLDVALSRDGELVDLPVSEVEVHSGRTTLVRRGGGVVVRQHVLVRPDDRALVLLLESSARDTDLRFSFQPHLQLAWPGSFGGQYAFWDGPNEAFVLSESLQRRNAVVGIPGGTPVDADGTRLAVDVTVGRTPVPVVFTAAESTRQVLMTDVQRLVGTPGSLRADADRWAEALEDRTVRIETPDERLNRSFAWAKAALAGHRVCNPALGCGLTAGWGDGFRPGQPSASGQFDGRSAGVALIGLARAGLLTEMRDVLQFQARFQRDDGKMPGHIPQAAAESDWLESVDIHDDGLATPLWVLGMLEYWQVTGDNAFLEAHWPSVEAAVEWAIGLETNDNGLMELDGAGIVPDGPLADGLREDAFIAGIWVAAIYGVAEMASAVGEHVLANLAADLARLGRQSLNQMFWRENVGHHALGLQDGGARVEALTPWPSVGAAYGHMDVLRMESTLHAYVTGRLQTDWGMRSLSARHPLYDPERTGYGAVDPVATGFAAWAQYAHRRPWAGYPNVQALAGLAEGGAHGRIAGRYSGTRPEPLAGTLPETPEGPALLVGSVVGGLLGWTPESVLGSAVLRPQLPPSWGAVRVENLRAGDTRVDVDFTRSLGRATATFRSSGERLALTFVQAVPIGARGVTVRIDGRVTRGLLQQGEHDQQVRVDLSLRGAEHTVEITWRGGAEIDSPSVAPTAGSEGLRIVNVRRRGANLAVQVDGEAGATYTFAAYGARLRPATNADGVPSSATVLRYDEETGRSEIRVTLPRGEGRSVVNLDFVS